jgi:hypothetical protein
VSIAIIKVKTAIEKQFVSNPRVTSLVALREEWKRVLFSACAQTSTCSTLAFIPNKTCRDKFSGTLNVKDFYAGAVLGSPRKHSLSWPSNNALWRQHAVH